MKAKSILFLAVLFFAVACNNQDCSQISEGDIVFIESRSSQSPYIKYGTMSRWTHCGVVVATPDGLQVLEASKTVRLTPIDKFISAAKNGNWCVKSPDNQIQGPISYRKYLGQSYDLEFKFDNGKMYCSELVWLIYKEHGIELCPPRKVSSYVMTIVPQLRDMMIKRNISMEQEVVAPVDLYNAL